MIAYMFVCAAIDRSPNILGNAVILLVGTEVVATTDCALDLAVVGEFLDATVIKRQRRIELEAQFDYLESIAR